MKKVIRLTESDLTRIVKRVIKENEEEVLMQKIESNPKLSSKMDMVVDYLSNLDPKKIEKIEDIVNGSENMKGEFSERKVTKYYDYDQTRPTELTKNQFLKRKLLTILPSTIVGAIMGIAMAGGTSADDVIQMALGMATSTGLIGAGLISAVGREKVEVPDEEETQDSVTENYIRRQLRYYR